MPSAREIAAALPDIPRWVHVRGMLLDGRGVLVEPVGAGPLACVVEDRSSALAFVVGPAPAFAIQGAAASAAEVLAFPENRDWVTAALPDWQGATAALHVRSNRSPPLPANNHTARLLPRGTVAALSHLPPDLAAELRTVDAAGTAIGAAFHDDCPVAFCYAASVTESLWDVSVDTLAPHRRRGMAAAAVTFMIEHWARLGRAPVWGAAEPNPGSERLAAKLGFVAIDSLCLFHRPQNVSPILLELLSWIADRRRTYAETMQAWRSTWPRHTVWEEAVAANLVQVESGRPLHESTVTLTPRGTTVLTRQPR